MNHEQFEHKPHGTPPHGLGFDLGEDVDAAIGVTAAAFVGDQLMRATGSKKHKASHLMKAGLSAAVALEAFKMMHREHDEKHHPHHSIHQHSAAHYEKQARRREEAGQIERDSLSRGTSDYSFADEPVASRPLDDTIRRVRSFSRHRKDEWDLEPSTRQVGVNEAGHNSHTIPSGNNHFSPHRHRRSRSISPSWD